LQQNQTKKSVSFSENIAKHLISPCNPAMKFDTPPELVDNSDDDDDRQHRIMQMQHNDLTLALHGNNRETPTRKVTPRYGEMRRCQSKSIEEEHRHRSTCDLLLFFKADIIVMDRVHHLHSFTESPPNEFQLQETDSLAPESDDDQAIQEKAHVNVVPNLDEPVPVSPTATPKPRTIIENTTPFNDKENESPEQTVNMNASITTLVSTNDSSLDGWCPRCCSSSSSNSHLGLLERVANTVKRFFDIKRSQKVNDSFFSRNRTIWIVLH
jgi:hypothetical protein